MKILQKLKNHKNRITMIKFFVERLKTEPFELFHIDVFIAIRILVEAYRYGDQEQGS